MGRVLCVFVPCRSYACLCKFMLIEHQYFLFDVIAYRGGRTLVISAKTVCLYVLVLVCACRVRASGLQTNKTAKKGNRRPQTAIDGHRWNR